MLSEQGSCKGAHALSVYPQAGMTFAGASTNTALSVAPGRAVGLIVASAAMAVPVFSTPSFG